MVPRFVWTIANRVFRSRRLARLLFGVEVAPIGPDDHYFDVSTWVLVRHVARKLAPDMHLVDLGTGTQAVIGIALWRQCGCRVTSVDVDPDILQMAAENIFRNAAEIRAVRSEFFDALPEPFDWVTFNPPYVRSQVGAAHGLPGRRRSQWDGGSDGLDVTRGFLKALAERPHAARFSLALNTLHVDRAVARRDIHGAAGIELEEEFAHPWLPVVVFSGRHRPG